MGIRRGEDAPASHPPNSCPHRFTKLAGDAPLLPRWIPPQRMLATEAGADLAFLEGVHNLHETKSCPQADLARYLQHCSASYRDLLVKKATQGIGHASNNISQEEDRC